MTPRDDLPKRLERIFESILRQRMHDMPVLNPALSVQAIGFRPWDGFHTGILLTPWFMNLMAVPAGTQAIDEPPGREVVKSLPTGQFRFVVGEEAELGRYLSCSLFSPVFEFTTQDAAVAVAEAILDQLFQPPEPPTLNRRELLFGRANRSSETPAR